MTQHKQNHPRKQSATQLVGNDAESMAKQFLERKGLLFLQHQFRTKWGEIDLIMRNDEDLVFVEVRSRTNDRFVDPVETISKVKRRRLIRTAQFFQLCNPWTSHYYLRFDIISVLGDKPNCKITWIPNAFGIE